MNMLNSKRYKIDICFEFFVDCDSDLNPESIIGNIKEQISVRKVGEGFLIDDMYMTYQVFKIDDKMVEV